MHNDDEVSCWYDNEKPSLEQAGQQAKLMGDSWRFHGVHKWIAHDRVTGQVVGRGGLSRTPVDDDWGQIYAFLPAEPWVRVAHEIRRPFIAHANWVEIGWALRREFWGRGYASEIGRASGGAPVRNERHIAHCAPNRRAEAVSRSSGKVTLRVAGIIRSATAARIEASVMASRVVARASEGWAGENCR